MTLGLFALLAGAPILILIAVMMRVLSAGPVLTRSTRVGLDRRLPFGGLTRWRRQEDHGGRLFELYQFRTTPRVDAAGIGETGAWLALTRFLRRTRLEMLPQLVNVVRGDINLVGPEPQRPGNFVIRRNRLACYPRRQRILPGIVGPAIIARARAGARGLTLEQELSLDLSYIDTQSVAGDLRILLVSAWVLVRQIAG